VLTSDGDLAMALDMTSREAVFSLGPYPEIREFAALLEHLPETGYWKGVEFMGYTNAQSDGRRVTRFYFRRAGTAFGFSPEEWDALKRAFRQALRSPEMVPVLAELHLQYGDV
jgi:hypothetical protein